MKKIDLQLFSFQCPACGTGDADHGHQVSHDEPYCMVCFMDDGRVIRLRRWAAQEPTDGEIEIRAQPRRACA